MNNFSNLREQLSTIKNSYDYTPGEYSKNVFDTKIIKNGFIYASKSIRKHENT